jgi:hypothetical protein
LVQNGIHIPLWFFWVHFCTNLYRKIGVEIAVGQWVRLLLENGIQWYSVPFYSKLTGNKKLYWIPIGTKQYLHTAVIFCFIFVKTCNGRSA